MTGWRARIVVVTVALSALAGCTPSSPGDPVDTTAGPVSPTGAGPLGLGDIPLTPDIAPAELCDAYVATGLDALASITLDDPTTGTGQGTVASGEPWGYCQAIGEVEGAGAMVGVGVYPAGAVEAIRTEPYCTQVSDVSVDGLPSTTCVAADERVYQLLVAVQVTDDTAVVLQTLDGVTPKTATPDQVRAALRRFLDTLAEQLAR